MKRLSCAVALVCLAACDERPDIPTENFPPVGLASTAIWLESRQSLNAAARLGATQARQATLPDSRFQNASAAEPTIPTRSRPTTRRGRAVQAFADICVASIPDVAGLVARAQAVNLRDFDEPARVARENNAQAVLGGIDDGPIRVVIGVNPDNDDTVALCTVTAIGSGARATAQAKVDAIASAGFGLQPIAAEGNSQQSFRIVGAPEGTTVSVRTNIFGVGVNIAWR
ncbi:MAG: hypothetical protein AAF601_07300 [Pseudomonadota bacterium]